MKKIFIFLVQIIACFILQAQNNYFKPGYSTLFDSSKGDILLHQSRSMPRITRFWNATNKENNFLEKNFKKVLAINSSFCEAGDCKVASLTKFVYQYIGVFYQGKRFIYVNAFSFIPEIHLNSKFGLWETGPVSVRDGENSFWGVLFDPEKQEFVQLSFNGES